MSVAEISHLEREELESVLASGIFERSPSLAQALTYICTKFFVPTFVTLLRVLAPALHNNQDRLGFGSTNIASVHDPRRIEIGMRFKF